MRRLLRRYRWHLELGLVIAVIGAIVWAAYPRIQERVERDRRARWQDAQLLIHQGDLEGLQTFLDAHSLEWLEPNGRRVDEPLINFAAGQRNLDMVRLLLDHGADVDGRSSSWGTTPILSAIKTQDPQYHPEKAAQMVSFLIKNGADVNTTTHLAAAVKYGEHDALKVLLNHGADENRVDRATAKSAVELARDIECAKCLEIFGEPPPASKTNPRDFEYQVKTQQSDPSPIPYPRDPTAAGDP